MTGVLLTGSIGPVKKRADRFVFSPELGHRLAGLRDRAGLTKNALAQRMGIEGKGGHNIIRRLERGEVRQASIGIIADFLRACRASFDDIGDVLKQYTDQPTVTERREAAEVRRSVGVQLPEVKQAAVLYDKKTALARKFAGRPPEKAEVRAKRARRVAVEEAWRRRLHSYIVNTINTEKLKTGGLAAETHLQKQMQKFWKELAKSGRRPEKQDKCRAEFEQQLIAEQWLDPKTVQVVLSRVVELFRRTEIAGR